MAVDKLREPKERAHDIEKNTVSFSLKDNRYTLPKYKGEPYIKDNKVYITLINGTPFLLGALERNWEVELMDANNWEVKYKITNK